MRSGWPSPSRSPVGQTLMGRPPRRGPRPKLCQPESSSWADTDCRHARAASVTRLVAGTPAASACCHNVAAVDDCTTVMRVCGEDDANAPLPHATAVIAAAAIDRLHPRKPDTVSKRTNAPAVTRLAAADSRRARGGLEPPVGIEPTTYSLRVNRSAD